jgi:hypothetical protein
MVESQRASSSSVGADRFVDEGDDGGAVGEVGQQAEELA